MIVYFTFINIIHYSLFTIHYSLKRPLSPNGNRGELSRYHPDSGWIFNVPYPISLCLNAAYAASSAEIASTISAPTAHTCRSLSEDPKYRLLILTCQFIYYFVSGVYSPSLITATSASLLGSPLASNVILPVTPSTVIDVIAAISASFDVSPFVCSSAFAIA